jgi:hypothetical protein
MSNAGGSEYNSLETELDDGSNDSVGHQNTKPRTAQKKHNSCVKKSDSEFQRQHHGDWVDEESDDGSDDNFRHQNKRSTAPKNYDKRGQRGEPEFQRNYYGDWRDDELQQQLYELKEENRKLQVELRKLNVAGSRRTKLDLQSLYNWSAAKATLANRITEFCKDYLFPKYKFLDENWQVCDLDNKNSLSSFVSTKVEDQNPHMRIVTINGIGFMCR